jgi:hypothetical protein
METLSRIYAIASNTFKEAVRNRVLYVLLFFAILILIGAWVASSLAIFGQERIVRDLGVAAINIISVLIAVFVGVGLVYNDLDKKTIYTIVSKPISRWHFIVGKYFGLLMTIWVNIIIMTYIFLVVLLLRAYTGEEYMTGQLFAEGKPAPSGTTMMLFYAGSVFTALFQSLGVLLSFGMWHPDIAVQMAAGGSLLTQGVVTLSALTMLEMAVITAFAVLFSSFSSPTLSAFLTLTAFIIGRLNQDLYFFADLMMRRAGGIENLSGGQVIAYWFSVGAAHVAPNLSFFDQRGAVADMKIPTLDFFTIRYAAAYATAVLIVASMIFNRRNFK